MTLKTWLENQNANTLCPGDTVYIVHKDNGGLSLLRQKVKNIGTKYITTQDTYERRFKTCDSDLCLIEEVVIGHPGHLYLTKENAVQYIHTQTTKRVIRQNMEYWLQTSSDNRIRAAALILSGEASDIAVETFLSITKHE